MNGDQDLATDITDMNIDTESGLKTEDTSFSKKSSIKQTIDLSQLGN
jgi:hypothetical protein